jgi:hypothetical protein
MNENAWPPLLPTSMAARYCGYADGAGIHKAHERGKLFPVGRRGGTGCFMWRREDLDRFLRGEGPTNAPPMRPSRRKQNRDGAVPSDTVAAILAQLREQRAARKNASRG